MKNFIAIAFALMFGLADTALYAMPVVPDVAPPSMLNQTAGGCGPGFHRGPYGGCRRNGWYNGGYWVFTAAAPGRAARLRAIGAARCSLSVRRAWPTSRLWTGGLRDGLQLTVGRRAQTIEPRFGGAFFVCVACQADCVPGGPVSRLVT